MEPTKNPMQMKNFILSFLLVGLLQVVHGQINCGPVSFATQAEVDQFAIDHPDCTEVSSLYIEVTDFDEIVDLSPLSGITTVTGAVEIYVFSYSQLNTAPLNITSVGSLYMFNAGDFSGFSNLTSIQTDLTIIGNEAYFYQNTDFAQFDNLESCGYMYLGIVQPTGVYENVFPSLTQLSSIQFGGYWGPFGYEANMDIASITGFSGVTSMNNIVFGITDFGAQQTIQNIEIFNNLVTLDSYYCDFLFTQNWNSFAALESANNFTSLMYNPGPIVFPQLETIGDGLVWLGGDLGIQIYEFPSLTTADALVIWEFPVSDIEMSLSAPVLVNINSLEITGWMSTPGNTTVEASYDFSSVSSLERLVIQQSGISSLSFLSSLNSISNELVLTNNPNLSMCAISAVCDFITNVEPSDFLDINYNNDGCNTQEEVLSFCSGNYINGYTYIDLNCNQIMDDGEDHISFLNLTDADQNVIATSNSNGFVVFSYVPEATISFQAQREGFLPLALVSLTPESPYGVVDYNFGLCPDPNFHNLSVNAFTWIISPGFTSNYTLQVTNHSNNTETYDLTMDWSEVSNYTMVNSGGGIWNGALLEFNDLEIGPYETVSILLQFVVATNTPLGTPWNVSGFISMTGDQNATDDTFENQQVVVGSFDPNDITVDRSAIDYDTYDSAGEWLHYQIRFQNTGTAAATFISVLNTIDQNLDLSTLQVLETSHNAEVYYNDNREMEFFFNDILLPDSISDPEGSNGFIWYRIKTAPNLGLTDIIESTAAIYFDYNEPVITNTATTEFYVCPESLYPTENIEVCFDETIELTADNGWDTYEWTIDGGIESNSNQVSFANLGAGTYTIQIQGNTSFCESNVSFELTVKPEIEVPVIGSTFTSVNVTEGGNISWYFNNELLIENVLEIENAVNGEYYVIREIDGCTVTSLPFIFYGVECFSMVSIAPVEQYYCAEETVSLTAEGEFDTFTWYVNDIELALGASFELTLSTPGMYEVEVVGSTAYCEHSETVELFLYSSPNVTITQNFEMLVASGTGTFEWTLNGQNVGNTAEIVLNEMGEYVVTATSNGCSASSSVVIDACEDAIGITGPNSTCHLEMNEINLSGPFIAYTTYWNGEEAATGDFASLQMFVVGEHQYVIEAIGEFCMTSTTFDFTVYPVPAIPNLTQEGNLLIAEGDGPFIWHLNGNTLTETGPTLTITESGVYNVGQTNGNCESLFNGGFYEYIGIEENLLPQIQVYPNPAADQFIITANGGATRFNLFAMDGRLVLSDRLSSKTQTIACMNVESGCYTLVLYNDAGVAQGQSRVVIHK
jgi:hypothetical protein